MPEEYRHADNLSIGTPMGFLGTMPPMEKTVGQRIRDMRKFHVMTQVALAKKAGITQASLSELETGESAQPSAIVLLKIAMAFECSPWWLLTGRGSMTAAGEVSIDEGELLAAYRGTDDRGREDMLDYARISLERHPKPSRASPFKSTNKSQPRQ